MRHHPLLFALVLIILAVIIFRISFLDSFFGNSLEEARLWIMFITLVLFVTGMFSIWVWVRNNVPLLNTQHKVIWRNR